MSTRPQNDWFLGGLFKQGDFQIDPNSTPETLARKRELLAAMMPQYGKAQYVGQGIGQLFQGIGAGRKRRAMDKFEGEMRANAPGYTSGAPGYTGNGSQGPMSVLGMRPPQNDPAFPLGQTGPAPSNDVAPGGWDMGANADWLRYSNQNATRNQPISAQLNTAMSFLGDMGITMDVVSGGQDGAGTGGNRTGSTRHDNGDAADADFYMGGRKLDWNNPDDLPIFQEIQARAQANGVTGIGAGDDYMGAGRMHVGFGDSAVWGAGGKGANAPDWLSQGGTQVAQNNGGQGRIDYLSQILSNPWSTPPDVKQAQAELTRIYGQQDRQQGITDAQADPLYQAQLQKLTLANEQVSSGEGGGTAAIETLAWRAKNAGLEQGTPEFEQFILNGGGDPSNYRSLEMQALNAGLEKGTPEFEQFMLTRGAGSKAYASGIGGYNADIELGGDAAAAVAEGKVVGSAEGQAKVDYASLSSKLPGLLDVVSELRAASEVATYTLAGQAKNYLGKQFGLEPAEGAKARTKYTAMVANQILPMLKDTFGAAFTVEEGRKLEATMGDADATPAEKQIVLDAFIDQVVRNIEAKAREAGVAQTPTAATEETLETFSARADVQAAAAKAGVTVEEMWAIKQENR